MDIWSLVLLLGAVQGILLAVFLILHKSKPPFPNRILAAFLVVSIFIIASPEIVRKYHAAFPHLIGSTFTITFLLGPLLFFYVEALNDRACALKKSHLLHLLPFIAGTAYLFPFYLHDGAYKIEFFQKVRAEGLPVDFFAIWGLECLHVIFYFFLALQSIERHASKIKNAFSSVEKINLQWLRKLTMANICIWALFFAAFVLYFFKVEIDPFGVMDYAFGYAMSILVYGIGYMGLKQPAIFAGMPLEPPALPDSKKYERSSLAPDKAQAYARQLAHCMETRQPFKNAELTLQALAAQLAIPPNHLSQVINELFGQNFYDFVNKYRVQEAQKALRDRSKRHLTILAIAYEAGFNSKSAFNAAFKKHANQTPSQYQKMSGRVSQDDFGQ